MSKYIHELPNDVMEGWEKGDSSGWRPSIAMPYFVGFGLKKSKCGCGRVFKSQEDFEAHYLYMAIWKNESNIFPTVWSNLTAELLETTNDI